MKHNSIFFVVGFSFFYFCNAGQPQSENTGLSDLDAARLKIYDDNINRSILEYLIVEKKVALLQQVKEARCLANPGTRIESLSGNGDILDDIQNFRPNRRSRKSKNFIKTTNPSGTAPRPGISLIEEEFPQAFSRQLRIALSYFEDPSYYDTCYPRPQIFNKFLLYGPPGSGKSYLVETIQKAFQLPLISLKCTDFDKSYLGEGTDLMAEIFNIKDPSGRPVLLFIDEIDGLVRSRTDAMHRSHRSLINALLIEIQNHTYDPSLFIFVATNDKDALDDAFLNRFEGGFVEIVPMKEVDRHKMLEKYYKNLPLENKQVSIKVLAKKSQGLSRRALIEVMQNSYSWMLFLDKNRLSYKSPSQITLNTVLHEIKKVRKDRYVALSKRIGKFMKDSLPYMQFAQSLIGTSINIVQFIRSIVERHADLSYRQQRDQESRDQRLYQRAMDDYNRKFQLSSLYGDLHGIQEHLKDMSEEYAKLNENFPPLQPSHVAR